MGPLQHIFTSGHPSLRSVYSASAQLGITNESEVEGEAAAPNHTGKATVGHPLRAEIARVEPREMSPEGNCRKWGARPRRSFPRSIQVQCLTRQAVTPLPVNPILSRSFPTRPPRGRSRPLSSRRYEYSSNPVVRLDSTQRPTDPTTSTAAQLFEHHHHVMRASHKKSRQGCLACKKRHVKVGIDPIRSSPSPSRSDQRDVLSLTGRPQRRAVR